jgi:hypothetical protein
MLVWIASVLFLVMAAAHFAGALWFAIWIARHDQRLARGEFSAPVAVLLSIRGKDPFLGETLQALCQMDYPQVTFHVVVDGTEEEAREWREAWQGVTELRHPLFIETLKSPRVTCGRKCAALLQVLAQIPEEAEVIALIDADVVPDRLWLKKLTAPLVDEQIGVVTGGQWFEPAWSHKPGAWVRSLWNAGSLVPTSIQGHPWAGSLAIRRRDFVAAELGRWWETSAVDDGPIARAMHQIGSRIAFDPQLIAVNREDCGLGYSARYVSRMLTWSRWYEAAFWNTASHAVLLAMIWGLWLISLMRNVYDGAWQWVGVLTVALVVGIWLYVLAYDVVRYGVARLHRHRLGGRAALSISRQAWAVLHLPLTQAIFLAGVFRAMFFREVEWRGVRYRIHSPTEIRVLRAGQPPVEEVGGQDSV